MTQTFADKIKSEIGDHQVSAELRARVDEWLKADSAFNVWFLDTTKRALADDELMGLLEGYRESQEIVEEAWEAFEVKKDETTLIEAMTQSMHRMKLLQEQL